MAAWVQGDVDALQMAIKQGVLTVSYDGPPRRTITYQSTRDMLTILATAQQSVNVQAGGSTFKLIGTRKGT